MMIDLYSVVRS